jgi:hypothetical protein
VVIDLVKLGFEACRARSVCSNLSEYPEMLRKASYEKYLYLQGFCKL